MKDYIQAHIFNNTAASFDRAMKTQATADVKFSHRLISAHQEASYNKLAKIAGAKREIIQAKIQKYENYLSKLKPYISEIPWIAPENVRISFRDEHSLLGRRRMRRVLPIVNIVDCKALNVDLRKEIVSIQLKYTIINNINANQTITPSLVFSNCSFSGSNLACLNLNHSVMRGMKLNRANLSHTKLNYVDLQGADLRDANLSGADLFNANLIAAKLNGANLAGAVFRLGLKYSKINLCNNNIEGAKIFLKLPFFWDEANLNEQLNHIDSRPQESLLTVIDQINDKFAKEKKNCFHQIIESLEKYGVNLKLRRFPRKAIIVFFTSKKYLMADEKINKFVRKVLRSEIPYIENNGTLSQYHASVLNMMLNIILGSNNERSNKFHMLDNNNFFITLISRTVYSPDLAIRTKSRRLYQIYLALKPVNFFLKKSEFGNEAGKVDWSDKDASNYILIKNEFAMIISHNNLTNMLSSSSENLCSDWYRFYFYINGNCQPLGNVSYDALFLDIFKIFMNSYISSKLQVDFASFLQSLNLAEYEKKFILALSGKHFLKQNKLIKTQDQMRLSVLFHNKIKTIENNNGIVLESSHYKEILHIFKLQNSSHQTIAQKLFCCSFMFVKYSSSHFFGTELDSPQVLRNYASALMHKANELDPNVVGPNYLKWNKCMLGLDHTYACAYFLSEAMLQHAKTHFYHITCTTVPPSWG